ncbi:hypothetical protein [Streptomyces sp. NPDC059928]
MPDAVAANEGSSRFDQLLGGGVVVVAVSPLLAAALSASFDGTGGAAPSA